MAHTPAPWRWSTYDGSHLLSLFGPNLERIITHNDEAGYEVTLDNGALLEATPDLLVASKKLVAQIDNWMDCGERPCPLCDHHHKHDSDCPYLDAEAAIAKAESTNRPGDITGRVGE